MDGNSGSKICRADLATLAAATFIEPGDVPGVACDFAPAPKFSAVIGPLVAGALPGVAIALPVGVFPARLAGRAVATGGASVGMDCGMAAAIFAGARADASLASGVSFALLVDG